MKKIMTALAVSVLASTAFADGDIIDAEDPVKVLKSTLAVSASVNVSGSVTQSTCEIGTAVEGAAPDVDVVLGDVPSNLLRRTNDTSASKPFAISLVNCPATYKNATSVYIQFDGSDDAKVSAAGTLKNTTADGTNAVVEILNQEDNPINLKTNDNSLASALHSHIPVHVFSFAARFKAANGPATAGKFTSTVPFSIAYK